jgi:hypothetical protein
MNNIGFGIFCFGEEYYYKGTVEKIDNILDHGFSCYILTEDTEYFTKKYLTQNVHVFEYNRTYKSYADKMILPKYVLKQHDICILLDADTYIKDYSILNEIKLFDFKEGISYIDTLENHKCGKGWVKDLIVTDNPEWKYYHEYANRLYSKYIDFPTLWEYFLIINKKGFNQNSFYGYYEKLQLAKEFSDLFINKEINGAGEGISIQIASKLSEINVERDLDLYNLLKDKIESVSRRYTRPEFWPEWMK